MKDGKKEEDKEEMEGYNGRKKGIKRKERRDANEGKKGGMPRKEGREEGRKDKRTERREG